MLVCLRLSNPIFDKVCLLILIQLIKSDIFHCYLLIVLDPVNEIYKLHGNPILFVY